MSITRLIGAAALTAALVAPGTAAAGTPTQTACNAYVYVGEGSVRHGSTTVTTPEQTVRLGDHTGALGEQDPCAA